MPLKVTYPATGQSGTGRSYLLNSYLYTGGTLSSVTAYNESGTQIRQTSLSYGLEGELLSRTGSTEPVSYSYDGLYRLKSLSDGNSHSSLYSFNTAGYLASISYPRASGAYDTVQFTSYDADGNALTRVDGNNVTTNYTFNSRHEVAPMIVTRLRAA